MRHRGALILLTLVCSCSAGAPVDVANQPTVPPVPQEIDDTERLCEKACKNLQRLECPEGEPDSRGATCFEVCVWTKKAGIVELDLEGVAESEACP